MIKPLKTNAGLRSICVLAFLLIVFGASAQNRISLNVQNKPLRTILSAITQQSGYNFVYSSELKEIDSTMTVKCDNAEISAVLDKLFADRQVNYKINGKNIALSPARVAGQPAQKSRIKITGTITDDSGIPIPGVAVTNLQENTTAISGINGEYDIYAKAGDAISFSSIGMIDHSFVFDGKRARQNVSMKTDIIKLEDVVVTGYQTISKERASGSFAVVTPKAMENKLQTNVIDKIEGMVAGLNINRTGGSKTISIRGISTLNGDRNPLYVVDGVPFEGEPANGSAVLDMINPSDIENITVLKDATAASIYGARSANGVIVITTKSGQEGATKVNYSNTISFQGLPDRDYSHIMNSSELVDYQMALMETYPNVKRQTKRYFQNPVQVLLMDYRDKKISKDELDKSLQPYRDQDRYDQVIDEFLRKQSLTHQHNLSFSGGSDIYKYSVSFNYTGTAPYEKAQYENRIGFNVKNTFDFFKWLQVTAGIMGSQVTNDYDNGISGMSLLNAGGASYYMLRDDQGNPVQWYQTKSQYEIDRLKAEGLQDESYYPAQELKNMHYSSKSDYLNLNLGAKFKIVEGLDLDLRFQREMTSGFTKQYYTKNAINVRTMINDATQLKDGAATHNVPEGGQVVQKNLDDYSYTARAQVNYNKRFNECNAIQALAGSEVRRVVTSGNGFYRLGYDDDNLAYSEINALDMNQGIYGTEALYGSFWFKNITPQTTFVDNRYVSFYANGSYMFKDRLTLTGSIRMDQSNLFGTDPKYQYRPLWSIGANYLAIKDLGFVNRLSVRATYGINGNIPKLNGPYLIASVGRNNYYTNESTMYIASPPNPTLRWEKTKVLNLGLDFDLFSSRLSGSFEFYDKNTSDLLGAYSLDPTLGWNSVDMNFGSMYNRGVELTLNSVNIESNGFRWTTGLIFSYNKNKITKIETTSESASSYWSSPNNRVGYPMSSMFSVRYKGLNENGAPVAYKADGTETLKYSELTKDDLVYSGTYIPPYNASLTNMLSYKGFDLSFMFIYAGGNVMRDIAARYCITSHPIYAVSNTYKEMANYWKQAGDEKNPDCNPAFMFQSTVRNGEYIWKAADKHIQKGDYIKLRTISLAYNLPSNILEKTLIRSARIVAQANNLWWWAANKSKLDPEIWSGSSLSPSRGTLYPAEFTIGLNLNF